MRKFLEARAPVSTRPQSHYLSQLMFRGALPHMSVCQSSTSSSTLDPVSGTSAKTPPRQAQAATMAILSAAEAPPLDQMGDALSGLDAGLCAIPDSRLLFCYNGQSRDAHLLHDRPPHPVLVWPYADRKRVRRVLSMLTGYRLMVADWSIFSPAVYS